MLSKYIKLFSILSPLIVLAICLDGESFMLVLRTAYGTGSLLPPLAMVMISLLAINYKNFKIGVVLILFTCTAFFWHGAILKNNFNGVELNNLSLVVILFLYLIFAGFLIHDLINKHGEQSMGTED